MRTIIIGDIHGCHQELLMLLAKVQLDRGTGLFRCLRHSGF